MSLAEDQATSLSATSETVHGPAVFATTHWSVVLEAQGESPAAQEALEKLCCTYWRPIYGYVRRHGAGTEDAEDLTQGFFALLLERKDLNSVRKEKGRLHFQTCRITDSLKSAGREAALEVGWKPGLRRSGGAILLIA